jgi:hypothetical protein
MKKMESNSGDRASAQIIALVGFSAVARVSGRGATFAAWLGIRGVALASTTVCPQVEQNPASGCKIALQDGQVCSAGMAVPQALQNPAPSWTGALHCGQVAFMAFS